MKWITRSHVHVDRVACPRLITRFTDSDAEFLFVPKSKVMEIAEKEGAIALIYGFGYGSLAPVTPYLIADRFGGQVLGAAYGLCTFFSARIGSALGPIIGGIIFDKTGSFRPGWIISMFCLLMILLLILALKPDQDRRRIKTP